MASAAAALALNTGERLMAASMQETRRNFRQKMPRARSQLGDCQERTALYTEESSAWICSRNDVLGNLAVLLAAAGVIGTGTGGPDVAVAAIMAALALQGALLVLTQSWSELKTARLLQPAAC
jgi:Co/Zn/Cd efflux system component